MSSPSTAGTAKRKGLTVAELKAELAEVARIGRVFVDGDLCREAYFPHARNFLKGDDMDFNPAAAVPLKKTLLRLERVARLPCSTALWRRRPDDAESGEALLFGSVASCLAGFPPANRGYRPPPMSPPLRRAFLQGKTVLRLEKRRPAAALAMFDRGMWVPSAEVDRPTIVQCFTPVRDSLGEIAAVLEVFAAAVNR